MHRFWALPLRRQLFLAILLLLVPVMGAVVWSGLSTYREHLQELGDQTRVVALTTSAAIDRELTSYDRMARAMSANVVSVGFDPQVASQVLRPQVDQRPSLIQVVVVTRDGTLVAREAGPVQIADDWSAVVSRVSSGQRIMSDLQVTPSGVHYVSLTYPITSPNGETVAALVSYVNPQRMQDLFGVLPLPAGSVVAVTDAERRVVVSSLDPELYIGKVQDLGGPSGEKVNLPSVRLALDGARRMYGEAGVSGLIISEGATISGVSFLEREGTVHTLIESAHGWAAAG